MDVERRFIESLDFTDEPEKTPPKSAVLTQETRFGSTVEINISNKHCIIKKHRSCGAVLFPSFNAAVPRELSIRNTVDGVRRRYGITWKSSSQKEISVTKDLVRDRVLRKFPSADIAAN